MIFKKKKKIDNLFHIAVAQSAGTVKYTDYISAER